jgi:hypothetical protein
MRIVEIELTSEEMKAVEEVRALVLLSSAAAAARLLIHMSLDIDDGPPDPASITSH